MNAWFNKLYDTFIASGGYRIMLEGLGNTIIITLGALIIGVVIGSIIAITKYFAEGNPRMKPLSMLCDLYTTVIRGIPITVLLLIFYLVIMVTASDLTVAILTFGINSGAYMAELIRSGINAVDKGQMEAGRSLGMSKGQTMSLVILPQAIRYILPAIGNEFIALVKETSVAGYVTIVDLTRAGNLVRNNTYDALNPLLAVALTYLTLVLLLTKIMERVEKKLAIHNK